MAHWRASLNAASVALLFAAAQTQTFAASSVSGAVPPAIEKFAALVSQGAAASKFKPAECDDLFGSGSPAFRSCFLMETDDCFHVQTQAQDRDPLIFAFEAHFKPSCSVAAITHAEAVFLEVFLSCDGADLKAKAIADFLAQPVDLSVPGAETLYEDYINEYGAYPGYQLKDACPAMTGVNIHDVIDGFPHRGIALYDLSKSSQAGPAKPKAD
jgi:hypothetical protein